MKIISPLLNKSQYKIFRRTTNGLHKIQNDEIAKPVTGKTNDIQMKELKTNAKKLNKQKKKDNDSIDSTNNIDFRKNEMKIQMLSRPLYDQIFKNSRNNKHDEKIVKR